MSQNSQGSTTTQEGAVRPDTKILIVEDNPTFRKMVKVVLEEEKFLVVAAEDLNDVLNLAKTHQPNLILMDVVLGDQSGINLCQQLKAQPYTSSIPVILLSGAQTDEEFQIQGFEEGADDYILKPYRSEDFLKLIRLYLKPDVDTTEQLRFGDLILDIATRRAIHSGRAIDLTMKEFELLKFLMEHPREVLTREQILENVWGYDFLGESNVIEVYIRYLRLKIEDEGQKRLIQTVRGVGYVLRES